MVKDPSYYPGCPNPPSKPAYTTPNLNPKQVSTPGNDPGALPSASSPTAPRSAPPHPNKTRVPLPKDPWGFKVKDKDGKPMARTDPGYRKQFNRVGKNKPDTSRRMDGEWKLFTEFITETFEEEYGDDTMQKLLNKELTDKEVSQVLAQYMENRIDLSHWRKFQVRKTPGL